VNGLDRFYDAPVSVTASLRGGPFDGEERPFPAALLETVCPYLVCVMPPGCVSEGTAPGPPKLLQRAVYQALRDADGFLSRDDAGRVRFDYWGLQ
jgi:hypothetical protein